MNLDFLNGHVADVAPLLLGCTLEREINSVIISGIIVETEAYDHLDAASHSFKGITPRTEVMFGPSGFMYVYFTYGMHYCCNIVTGPIGAGDAVLIRALQPIQGIDAMKRNRHTDDERLLTNGPAKLCQALAIDKSNNGHDVLKSPLRLIVPEHQPIDIVATTRVGISKNKEKPWRFYVQGNSFVSKM